MGSWRGAAAVCPLLSILRKANFAWSLIVSDLSPLLALCRSILHNCSAGCCSRPPQAPSPPVSWPRRSSNYLSICPPRLLSPAQRSNFLRNRCRTSAPDCIQCWRGTPCPLRSQFPLFRMDMVLATLEVAATPVARRRSPSRSPTPYPPPSSSQLQMRMA